VPPIAHRLPGAPSPTCLMEDLGKGVERLLVASSGLDRLAFEVPAARWSGWPLNEAPAGRGWVTTWLERGVQPFIRSARRGVHHDHKEALPCP
jgi:hypothetical protein